MRLSIGRDLSKSVTSKLETIIRTSSMLAIVINTEVAQTEAGFLAFGATDTWKHNTFSSQHSCSLLGLHFYWPNLHYSSYRYDWNYQQG